MSGKEELWRQAYEWMQQHGDQMPDARARAYDRLIGQRPSYYVKPAPSRSLIEELEKFRWPRDLSARQTIDDIERKLLATFDDHLGSLPDSFSGQIGQQGGVNPDELKEIHQLIQKAWQPRSHARYVDPDGEQHVTEILEDTDELCPCGATWRHDDCEHT